MSGDDRRMAAARRVLEAQKTFPQFYNEDKSESWVSQPMLQAMREAEAPRRPIVGRQDQELFRSDLSFQAKLAVSASAQAL